MSKDLDLPLEPDPVIEAYKKDVDVTLLIENLKLTPAERMRNLTSVSRFLGEFRGAAARPQTAPSVTPR